MFAAGLVLVTLVLALILSSFDEALPGTGRESDSFASLAMLTPAVAELPVEEAIPEMSRSVPNREALVLPTPTLEPAPVVVDANELGRIPIYMYHAFVFNEENTDEWTITFDEFRAQLDWLYANDFVAVGVNAMLDREFDIPAGKKPVILTFDDANQAQFGLQQAPDGEYQVHPDTAVGVLEEYREAYPGFIQSAFFAVLPYNCFAGDDDPSTCEERLQWLVEHGYEIGNHTRGHQNLSQADDILIKEEILEPIAWFDERIEGPNNLSEVLVLPFGMYPAEDYQVDWLFEGFWHYGEYFVPSLVLEVGGGPSRSPYHEEWRTNLPRINTDPEIFWGWAERIESGEVDLFVSDGELEYVTVPEGWESTLNTSTLAEDGCELLIAKSAPASS